MIPNTVMESDIKALAILRLAGIRKMENAGFLAKFEEKAHRKRLLLEISPTTTPAGMSATVLMEQLTASAPGTRPD
jgi:hypothetical protein